MKKFLAIVLSLIMLMSLCSMQGFAFSLVLPTVVNAEFTDAMPVSGRSIEDNKALVDEMYEEYEDDYHIHESDYDIDLCNYDFGYTLEVTLSDGSVHEIDLWDESCEIDDYTVVYIDTNVSYEDYLYAIENGLDTIEVYVECEVYSYISEVSKYTEFYLEKELADCIVDELVPLTTLDNVLYEDGYYVDMEDARFKVTYGDGTVETHTVNAVPDLVEGYFMMDGYDIVDYWYEDSVVIEYLDAAYEYDVTYIESPYESIEITDYTLNEAGNLVGLEYEITAKNGTKESFAVEFDEIDIVENVYSYVDIAVYDSYLISAFISTEYENVLLGGGFLEYTIVIDLGNLYSEPIVLEAPENADSGSAVSDILESIVLRILRFFAKILTFFR